VNFELLPTKLKYIESLQTVDSAKAHINDILANLSNNQFIKKFLKDEVKLEGDDQKSVVLGSRLLTVDVILLGYRLSRMRRQVESNRNAVGDKRNKLEQLKMMIPEKKDLLSSRKRKLSTKRELNNEELKSDNSRLTKQINISKSLLFQELLSLYILRKKRIGSRNVYTIAFSPMVSVVSLLEFGKEVIDPSLEKCIKFTNSVAKILLLILPYELPVSYSYISNHVFDLDLGELKLFTLVISKLIHNTVFLLRHLELVSGIPNWSQLFKLDELIYKLAYNDHTLEEVDTEQVPLDVHQLQDKIFGYLCTKTRSKRNEWHVVSVDSGSQGS
jgi:hypothetical protein